MNGADDTCKHISPAAFSSIVQGLFQIYFDKMTSVSTISTRNPVIAFYNLDSDNFVLNCNFVEDNLDLNNELLRFDGDQYKRSSTIEEKIMLLIEHEMVHMILYQNDRQPDGEAAHGRTFYSLINALFGHTWKDISIVHLKPYLETFGDKEAFLQRILSDSLNYDRWYAENVFETLQTYQTVP
jgi:hypothetical protein